MSGAGGCTIVGIGETAVGKPSPGGRSTLDLRLEASGKAIADASLVKEQIDGLITCMPRGNPQPNYSALLAQRMGIQPAYINDISLGGVGPLSMVINAVAVIEAGLCSTVLCVSGGGGGRGPGRLSNGNEDFRDAFGSGAAPTQYALAARRHMYEYGTTSRQLGEIAVACRRHASLNPNAQMRQPITVDDHQSSRLVADPFHLLDCSLVSTGAGAVVVTTPERGADLPHRPAHLLGMGYACRFSELAYSSRITTLAGHESSRQAFAMAGLAPADVDVAELYDCFTAVLLITLEDYGFCQKGEGGAFVENGRIQLGGELPVNTHGGLLSQAHIGGMLHITEAVSQLRGHAGPRQVEGAEVAAVSGQCGEGGIHATVLLGNDHR